MRCTYVATSSATKFRFSRSLYCTKCSFAEEGDGDALTDEARAAFIASEGRWVARIRDLGPRRTEALHALRGLRSDPPMELLRIVRDGLPLAEGARVEAEYFEEVLREFGVDVDVSRVD
ncbi:hypothetical protein AKJ09_11040 [Labilithrix luteola]|uniref:Uncharacterized protein n=1 Tax=Labilithrix luteola TaxID=1391654 RepID=A0A0K1QFF3_9BACT|nr:hypothetical protein AKJ09_11040 [Labilithrix luteola]